MSTGKRIIFTGGSGKAGRHAIPYLQSQGHKVLNLDLVPLNLPGVYDLKTDLTDSGQVFNAFTSLFDTAEYEDAVPKKPDVVIHFAAFARNMLVPDNKCFETNVVSTYNVIEAACKLGIKKIIVASSETVCNIFFGKPLFFDKSLVALRGMVYGVCFSNGPTDYHSFPLEEDYDTDPMDSYALSKLCGERTARTFARRFNDTDIYALRIGNVIEPHEYDDNFRGFVNNPETRKRNAWSYIDARDLGQICHLCTLKDGLGYQVFNATNDTITTKVPTEKFLKATCPSVPITRKMGEWEAPLSNRKTREVLGFKEEHNWRQYINTQ